MSVPGIFSRSTWQTSLRLQGHTRRENVPVNVSSVAPEYFSTLRIPLVRGRDFNSRDQEHSLAVVILSETVAQGLFNGDDPIGRRVVLFDAPSPVEVIGIVKDIRLKNILAGSPKLVYVPWSQGKGPIARFTTWQIRSALPIGTVSTELERAVRHRNPEFHPTASALVDVIAESIILQRLAAWLTGLLGFLGLLLAAIGIYGLVSYLTERRTAEIGIRLALGADASQVLWRTWCDAMQPVVLGLLAGLAVATATTHVLSSYLFGITPQDPLANGLGVLTLVSVAGIACYLPSRRASRIDPWTALRHE
jgi:putative ABC transport system permease protein